MQTHIQAQVFKNASVFVLLDANQSTFAIVHFKGRRYQKALLFTHLYTNASDKWSSYYRIIW